MAATLRREGTDGYQSRDSQGKGENQGVWWPTSLQKLVFPKGRRVLEPNTATKPMKTREHCCFN